MTEQEVFDSFLEFEDNNNLFQENIKGFNYWIYIRYVIYGKILEQTNNFDPISLPINSSKIKTAFNVLRNLLSEISHKNCKSADILIFESSRMFSKNGKYADVYTSFLSDCTSYKTLRISGIHVSKVCKSPYNKRELWNIPMLIANFKAKRLMVYDEKVLEKINKLQNSIENIWNVKFSENFLRDLINKVYILRETLVPYYIKRLNKIKPKVIIELCYYSPKSLILNEVASLLNIPTIELQHGTMGRGHLAYNFRNKFNSPLFPKYMYLFSDFWKETSLLPLPLENVKVTGFPYFESQLESLTTNKVLPNGKKVILFISQTTIGKELSKFAVKLSKLIDKEKYEIIYKLHPVECASWETRLSDLYSERESITVVADNKEPLYSLFNRSYAQVGVYSTAVYEGIGFNLKTYIIPLLGYARMEPLVDMNYASLVMTPKELIDNLQCLQEQSINTEKFWLRGSASVIAKNIGDICVCSK